MVMRILINIIECLSGILVINGILMMIITTFDCQMNLPSILYFLKNINDCEN